LKHGVYHDKEVREFGEADNARNNTWISHKRQTENSILQRAGYTLDKTLMYSEDRVKWRQLVHSVATVAYLSGRRIAINVVN